MFENNISDKNNNNIQDGPRQDETRRVNMSIYQKEMASLLLTSLLKTRQKEGW